MSNLDSFYNYENVLFQVIPALSAFCAYAAFGILGLYGLVSTFFVACLTLDQRRVEQSRDAIFFCFIHREYIPNKFSQMNLIQSFIEKVYSPTLMKLSCKVGILNYLSLILVQVFDELIWALCTGTENPNQLTAQQ